MTTELAIRHANGVALTDKIEYARFLAKSGLLPVSFREHPENVLYAYEMGELLGLHPMAAITGIHVIEGKPSISAGLISALVRRAGHRIRVQSTGDGDDMRARCQITRADDPGFTYSAVWDMPRAKQAGLLGKTNWQRYPAAMLKARAISECARDACQEVLLGIKYTPDELGAEDDGGEVVSDGFSTHPNGMIDASRLSDDERSMAGLMTTGQRVEHNELRRMNEPPPGAVVKQPGTDPDDPWYDPPAPAAQDAPPLAPAPPAEDAPHHTQARKPALDKLQALFDQLQLDNAEQGTVIHWLCGGEWTATASQVKNVCGPLEDFLKAADGDVAEARTALWARYRATHDPTDEDI